MNASVAHCSLDGCDALHKAKGLCAKHYRRLQRRGSVESTPGCHGNPEERFDTIGVTLNENDCHVWNGSKNEWGYGIFQTDGFGLAHRFSFYRAHGPIPEGMSVCHRCDNPPCTNPEHLFVATHAENMRDRDSKGRTGWAEKERNGNHALTEEDVTEIRKLYSTGKYLQRELGEMFGVEQTTVSTIVRNKTWKGVNERGN